MTGKKSEAITKGQISDVNNRIIFKNHTLCAQFLRDYTELDILKDITEEDIEDVTEKYQKYLGISFDTDTVKRIHIRDIADGSDMPMYIVSLVEHKSDVDYNVVMQLLQYMTCIWHDYELTMKNNSLGNAKNKDFRYPPILPIVYYEGKRKWTSPMSLGERIFMGDVFSAYVPDFTYKLINLHGYTNDELLAHGDEMSFLMMINRVQSAEDLKDFLNVNREQVQSIIDGASEGILEIIMGTIWNLMMKMNMPTEDAQDCMRELGERSMGNWFENMDKMDIQAERKNTAEARKELAEAKEKLAEAEGRLFEAENRLSDTRSELSDTRSELSDARSELSDTQSTLSDTKNKLLDAAITIINMNKKYSGIKESAVSDVERAIGVSKKEAEHLIEKYW